MRYVLFELLAVFIGAVLGWFLRGIVTREQLRREIIRAQSTNAPKDLLERLFKEL